MNAGAIGMAELLLFALDWHYLLIVVLLVSDRLLQPTLFSSENRPAAGIIARRAYCVEAF